MVVCAAPLTPQNCGQVTRPIGRRTKAPVTLLPGVWEESEEMSQIWQRCLVSSIYVKYSLSVFTFPDRVSVTKVSSLPLQLNHHFVVCDRGCRLGVVQSCSQPQKKCQETRHLPETPHVSQLPSLTVSNTTKLRVNVLIVVNVHFKKIAENQKIWKMGAACQPQWMFLVGVCKSVRYEGWNVKKMKRRKDETWNVKKKKRNRLAERLLLIVINCIDPAASACQEVSICHFLLAVGF